MSGRATTDVAGVRERRHAGYPLCPACTSPHIQKFDSVATEDVAVLASPAELDAFPGLVREQTVKHRAHVGGLLADYRFDVAVPCSNLNHPHYEGVVVRALCGTVLCLGMKCGADMIEDFGSIKRQRRAASDYREYQSVVVGLVGLLPKLLDRVAREVGPLLAFRNAVLEDTDLATMGRAMRVRFSRGGSLDDRGSVFVDDKGHPYPASDERKLGGLRSMIRGLSLFDRQRNLLNADGHALERVHEAAKEVRGWRERKPSKRRARELREQLGAMERKAHDLLAWGTDARRFLEAGNLREALFSVRLLKNVEIDHGSLRIPRNNGTIVIDARGSVFLERKAA
jgi:hypothetical protein